MNGDVMLLSVIYLKRAHLFLFPMVALTSSHLYLSSPQSIQTSKFNIFMPCVQLKGHSQTV